MRGYQETKSLRHKDLLLLLSEPLAARQFPDWSMQNRRRDRLALNLLGLGGSLP